LHPRLTLLNMEQISTLIENRQAKNLIEINRAETILLSSVHRYLHSYKEKEKRVFQCA
jgi:hypothetical protein